MSKNLIICPTCEENGTKSILGELTNNKFRIMRFHNGFTDIVGKDFGVLCGNCNETTYIKNERNRNQWQFRFSWINTWKEIGTL